MFGLFQPQSCPIGIDVGTHAIRMLQFRKKGEQLALQAACRIELEPAADGNVAARIREGIKRGLNSESFVGKRAVISLPPAAVHSKSIRLPQMPDSDLQQALQWEAKDRFGFETSDGQIVWFRAGEVRRGTEIKDELLLFAARGEDLALHIEAAAAAGLATAAIDLGPCAGYRSILRSGFQQPPTTDGLGILDIGHHASEFIITREDQLIFYKQIEIGGQHIDAAVGQKLGITPAEAAQMRARLASDSGTESADSLVQALQDAIRPSLDELGRELDMCMRYFAVTFRGTRPDLIAISGRQACCPRILGNLANSLAIRTESARPLRGVLDLGEVARPDRSSEWAIAAGLSLYPLEIQQQGAAA